MRLICISSKINYETSYFKHRKRRKENPLTLEKGQQWDRSCYRWRLPTSRNGKPSRRWPWNPQKKIMTIIKPLSQEFEDHGIDYRVALPIIEIYRNFRRRVRNSISTHHIVPQELGGSNEDHNKLRLIHRRHEWLHDYFGNEPTAQKIRVILEDDQTALKPGFITAVDALLEKCERRKWIYERGVWR